jgi:hypothetical protein
VPNAAGSPQQEHPGREKDGEPSGQHVPPATAAGWWRREADKLVHNEIGRALAVAVELTPLRVLHDERQREGCQNSDSGFEPRFWHP